MGWLLHGWLLLAVLLAVLLVAAIGRFYWSFWGVPRGSDAYKKSPAGAGDQCLGCIYHYTIRQPQGGSG